MTATPRFGGGASRLIRPQYGVHDLRSATWSEGDRLSQAADLVLVGAGTIDQATDGVAITGGDAHSHILYRRLRWSRIYRPEVEIVVRAGLSHATRPMVGLGSLAYADTADAVSNNYSAQLSNYIGGGSDSNLWTRGGVTGMGASLTTVNGTWYRWHYHQGSIDVYELPSGDPADWWDTSTNVLSIDLPKNAAVHLGAETLCPAASSPVAAIRLTEATA